jgi:hypothetical protein
MTPTGPAGRARRWEGSRSMRPGRWTQPGGGRPRAGSLLCSSGPGSAPPPKCSSST